MIKFQVFMYSSLSYLKGFLAAELNPCLSATLITEIIVYFWTELVWVEVMGCVSCAAGASSIRERQQW